MKVNFITPNKYSRPQVALKKHTAIVLTQFQNFKTADEARNYFDKLKDIRDSFVSSHYVIDADGNCVQCIPENEIAYAVTTSHNYSISIGLIGKNITPEMEKATLKLCINICSRYDINRILRHYDLTGAPYPKHYACNHETFKQFKNNVINFIEK